jgi:hypothetical protein
MPSPLAAPVELASTTSADGPDITSMSLSPVEPEPAEIGGGQADVEGETTSSREAPRDIQHRHSPQQMTGSFMSESLALGHNRFHILFT